MRTRRSMSLFLVLLLMSYTTALIGVFLVQRASAPLAPPVEISVSLQENIKEVGESFTIDIWATEPTDDNYIEGLHEWELKLGYDGSILYTDSDMIEEGPFLQSGGVTFFIFTPPFETPNYLAIGCLITSSLYDYAEGEGVLVSITFTVMDNGKTDLHLYDVTMGAASGWPDFPDSTTTDGVFYTTYPKASFSYLPSRSPGPTQFPPDPTLNRDPVLDEIVTFNASFFVTAGGFYRGSYDPDGTITSYWWDLGDGTTLTDPVITHAYSDSGTYKVKLNVTDDSTPSGKVDQHVRADVYVNRRDVAVTSIQVFPCDVISPGEEVSVNVTITNLGSIIEHVNVTAYYDDTPIWYNQTENKLAYSSPSEWEVDPSTGTLRRVQFEPGEDITVKYTWNTTGLALGEYVIRANISMVNASGTGFLRDKYLKELDSNLTNNELVYGKVTLTTLHNIAITDITLSPTLKPPATVLHGTTQVTVNVTVSNTGDFDETFYVTLHQDSTLLKNWTDKSLTAKTTTLLQYTWDTSALPIGNYTLKAQASNVTEEVEQGRTGDNTLTLKVAITTLPTASFTYTPEPPPKGELVTFNATDSQAAPGWTIASYLWRINITGSQPPASPDPTYQRTFEIRGTYNVTLKVTDSIGLTNSTSQIIRVGIPPTALFTFTPTAPKADDLVTFDASQSAADSQSAPGSDAIVSYAWNFSDGTQKLYIDANLTDTTTHSFAKSGNFSVTLTVIDGEGLNATITKFVVVEKISTTISLVGSPLHVQAGSTTILSGQTVPQISGAKVILLYRQEGGEWTSLGNTTTDASGRYAYDWVTTTAGTYQVKALWEGDDKYLGDETEAIDILVTEIPEGPSASLYLYLGAAIGITAIIIVAVYILRFRKRS